MRRIRCPWRLNSNRYGPYLVGDEEGAVGTHADALGVEAQGVQVVVVGIEGTGPAHERLPELVLEQPRVQQREGHLLGDGVGGDVDEVHPVEILHVGEPVERSPVGAAM